MLRIGIVGLGTISTIHREAIEQIDDAEVVALCDIDPTKQDLANRIPFYKEVEVMLAEAQLDVVHLCLPHHLHVPVGKLCVTYGVPFFTEKPLGITYQSAKELVELVETNHIPAGLCFQNRYNPTFVRLQQEIEGIDKRRIKGIKGLVLWYRDAVYYETEPWRAMASQAGYGTVINQSIHTLDLMQLIGGNICRGKGVMSTLSNLPIEVEDTATGYFTFDQGIKGYFHATNCYVMNDSVELQVVMDDRIYTIKDNALYLDRGQVKEILAKDETVAGEKYYYGASHQLAINAFYQAVKNKTEAYIHIREGLPSLEMIERMAGKWEEKQ